MPHDYAAVLELMVQQLELTSTEVEACKAGASAIRQIADYQKALGIFPTPTGPDEQKETEA